MVLTPPRSYGAVQSPQPAETDSASMDGKGPDETVWRRSKLETTTMQLTSDRIQRAIGAVDELSADQMPVESQPGGTFLVKGKYEVNPDANTCECKDHEYNETFCKHIVAVHLLLMWGEVSRQEAAENPTPDKPRMLTPDGLVIPETLKAIPQWVAWKQKLHENKDGSKRWTKVPIDAETGSFGKSNDSSTWTDYDTALDYMTRTTNSACGLGFVVSPDDNIVGIDFDDCRDPETGNFTPEAAQLIGRSGSYAEVSPSGTGARIFVKGEKETTHCTAGMSNGSHVEIYEHGRYLTVTGHHIDSTPEDVFESNILDEVERMCIADSDDAEMTLDEFDTQSDTQQ